MFSQKRKRCPDEDHLLQRFEKKTKSSMSDDNMKEWCESKDVKITTTFPPRPSYEQYSQMGVKLKLILKNKQKIKPLSSTTLVTTCHIAQPIDDYCLLVQPNDLINNLFVAKEMFVFSRFTGRISIPIQNVKDNQITLEAGTDIGDIHFIPFGIK